MSDLDPPSRIAQAQGQPLGDIDRAMPPAGTADCDCEIGFAAHFITRQQGVQQSPQPVEEWCEIRVSLDVGGNRRVAPAQRPKFVNIIRIIEKAHVEDQISLARDAAAIGEGSDEDAQPARIERKMAGQQALQIGGGQGGGIDHQIGAVAQGANNLALTADAVHDRPVSGQRMGPPRLDITPFEPLVVTVDEQHPQRPPGAGDHVGEGFEHRVGGKAAGSRVGADRDRRAIRRSALDQRRHQRGRQIVERLVTHVLEELERGRSPRPRHSRHQQDATARCVFGRFPEL